MARLPQQRAGDPSDEDDFYGEGQETDAGGDEGSGDGGYEGQEGSGEAEDDAAFDAGAEQETGGEEDLEPRGRRADPRFQRLANERNEWRRRAEDAERRTQPTQPRQEQTGETEQQFEARIQLLPFEERMEARYRRDKDERTRESVQTRV